MDRNSILALAALAAVLVAVLVGRLPGEALVTFLVGLGMTKPALTHAES